MNKERLKDVNSLVEEMRAEIEWPKKKADRPVVLLLGGFQGSGKTTVLNKIKDKIDLVVVSKDRVRQKLLSEGRSVDEEFGQVVDEVAEELFMEGVEKGFSLSLDTNAVPEKIEKIQSWIQGKGYRLIKVFLQADKKTLGKRIKDRDSIEGVYQGKVNELKGSMGKWGEVDKDKYDLIIDTERKKPEEIVEIVLERI